MAITSEFSAALNQVCAEKGISPQSVLDTITLALVSAYRKDFNPGAEEEVRAEINQETGEAKIFEGEKDVTPPFFGRIASQTAKQVLLQKLREAEKEAIFSDFRKKMGSLMSAHIFRLEKGNAILDLGRCQGVMPPGEQIPGENYQINQRLKILLKEIRDGEGARGPEVIVSRSDPRFIEQLFMAEVPELDSGVVTIKAVAREAGSRTKIAVSSEDPRVDPVGSCVGQKGVRVQTVIGELNGEKIDIIPFDEDPEKFIAAALSPAKIREVSLNKKKKEARVKVGADQLSLAIGKEGQNVRLAARLSGWKIDIGEYQAVPEKTDKDGAGSAPAAGALVARSTLEPLGLGKRLLGVLAKAGITSLSELKAKNLPEIKEIKGIGGKGLEEIGKIIASDPVAPLNSTEK
ncbi:MAG: transcription termination factor NusA [Patescibacteria group bacterium]